LYNIFFIGESGLGKSTLVNTLFGTTLYPNKGEADPSDETPKTVEIQSLSAGPFLSLFLLDFRFYMILQIFLTITFLFVRTIDIEENGVKLRLTVVDTPGFGDFVNNEER